MNARIVLVAATLIVAASYVQPQDPPAIKCIAPTPESIKAQYARELKQRDYDAAEEVASRVMRRNHCSDEFAEAIAQAAVDYRVNVRVLAALSFVESTCGQNPQVISHDQGSQHGGSVGLLQVNPSVWKQWTVEELKDPYINAQAGAYVLSSYVRKYGLKQGLHHYNGMGDSSDDYSSKVLVHAGLAKAA